MAINHDAESQTNNHLLSFCPGFGGRCLVDEIAQVLGSEILETLIKFILDPQPGARISLQRNQNEFTSQLTSPVTRSNKSTVGLSEIQTLGRNLPKPVNSGEIRLDFLHHLPCFNFERV